MRYLPWSVLALVTYSAVAPLMRVATTGQTRIPSDVAALVSNAILVVGTVVVVYASGDRVAPYLGHEKIAYVVAAGAFLTIGIIAYYRALSLGPVSTVTPIFGMFLVGSSVVGFVLLDEPFTARKGLGIVLAVAAVYLVTS